MYEKQTRYRKKHRTRVNKNLRKYYARRRNLIANFKNRPCMDCQGWFEPVQMDFDHRPGEIKLFGLGANYCLKWETVIKEIKKCDVVCANCHRLRTYRRNQYGASDDVLIDRLTNHNKL